MKLVSYLTIIVLLGGTLSLQAQSTIHTQVEIGGNYIENHPIVFPTDDGGFLVAGNTSSGENGSFLATSINPSLTGGKSWIILVKYDANHVIEWQKSFGGDDGDMNHGSGIGDLIHTSDGGWLIVGNSSLPPAFGNKTSSFYGRNNPWGGDAWVIKLDAAFNIQWQNSYGGSGDDGLSRGIELTDGSFLLGGDSDSPISGTKTDTCRGHSDYWLVKIDASGNQLWDKTIGSTNDESLGGLCVSSNGNITLSGSTYSDTATIVSSGDRSMSYGLSDFWIVSLDASGTILWNKTLGGGGFDFPYSSLTDGINYYIGGNSPKESIIPPTMRTAPRKGHSDGWLVKLDNNGNILWDKSYGGDSLSDQGLEYLIKVPNSQNLMVAGYSNSDAFNDKSENGFGDNDFWILKIDPSGNLLWDKTIGGAQDDGAGFITAIDSTTYFIGGFSYSGISGNKTSINYGDEDLWVIEIGSANLGLKTFTASSFNLFPNPTKDKISISGADLKQLQKIEITDLSGKVIFNTTNSSSNTNEISVSLEQLQTGTYFVRLIGENSASSYKIVKE